MPGVCTVPCGLSAFQYDDHDNPVEELSEDLGHTMRVDDGVAEFDAEPTRVQQVRYEYRYDTSGNWTERVVWQRTGPNADYGRSNI
jgi:hypothetical protein